MAYPRLPTNSPSPEPGCKPGIRPPPCPRCGGPAWWNGSRVVAQFYADADGVVSRAVDVVRLRAECSDPACPHGSWTLYEPQGYPHRTFTLEVAVSAVAELTADPTAMLTSVAQRCQCDRRTVGRMIKWVRSLGEPQVLAGLCARIDPLGLPPPFFPGLGRLALVGHLVFLLEHLARLLRNQGVPLERGSGLATILRYQFDRFRAVSYLTRASPPLHVALGSVGT